MKLSTLILIATTVAGCAESQEPPRSPATPVKDQPRSTATVVVSYPDRGSITNGEVTPARSPEEEEKRARCERLRSEEETMRAEINTAHEKQLAEFMAKNPDLCRSRPAEQTVASVRNEPVKVHTPGSGFTTQCNNNFVPRTNSKVLARWVQLQAIVRDTCGEPGSNYTQ